MRHQGLGFDQRFLSNPSRDKPTAGDNRWHGHMMLLGHVDDIECLTDCFVGDPLSPQSSAAGLRNEKEMPRWSGTTCGKPGTG